MYDLTWCDIINYRAWSCDIGRICTNDKIFIENVRNNLGIELKDVTITWPISQRADQKQYRTSQIRIFNTNW